VLERVRSADGRPVVFSRDVVPAMLLPADALERLRDGSLYDLLEQTADTSVEHGVVTLRGSVAQASHVRLVVDALRELPGVVDVTVALTTTAGVGDSHPVEA
jgi:DNA-binding GntR family transcriptional regulator